MPDNPNYDLLLKNGHLIDPKNKLNQKMDVAIGAGKIAKVAPDINPTEAKKVVDISGLYVTPGLIDIHVHVYHTRAPEGLPEGLSVVADHHLFRSGVTTAVDTGTAGAKHFLHFKNTVIDKAKTRIFAFVNVVNSGMLGDFEQDPKEFDPELAASIVLAYPEYCVGIKTAHYWTHQDWDEAHTPWLAIDKGLEASALCKKPLMVDFWPRPERPYPELLKKMRPGDIHTHVFAQQFPVLDENNKPQKYLFEHQERGIVFDLGHGAGSFWFRHGVPAMQGGFHPNSISTDLHVGNINGVVLDMLTTMSKMLNITMNLEEVVYRSTVTPALEIGHPELGHLSEGAVADVAVLRLEQGQFSFVDCGYAKMPGDKKLSCAMTVRAGDIVYDPEGLSMPLWQEAPEAYWKIKESKVLTK